MKRYTQLKEAKSIASKKDAEIVAQIVQYLNTNINMYKSNLSKDVYKVINDIDIKMNDIWLKIFRDTPWKVIEKGNKIEVYWDEKEAKKLNL